jgi:hypothetical protein
MPINGTMIPFTKERVDKAPAVAGVYALVDGEVLIYYGRALGSSETIRSRLQSHQAGREGRCTQQATHYMREPTDRPKLREKELLEEYEMLYGYLPRCNDRRV